MNLCCYLLVDLHSNHPLTIRALNNFFRCELAAGGLEVLDVMLRSLGPGWCFVVFAGRHFVALHVFWFMERSGLEWRREVLLRELLHTDLTG